MFNYLINLINVIYSIYIEFANRGFLIYIVDITYKRRWTPENLFAINAKAKDILPNNAPIIVPSLIFRTN